MGSGIKFPITIANAVPLPMTTWLGTIKKNSEAAANSAPNVSMEKSFIVVKAFFFTDLPLLIIHPLFYLVFVTE